MRVLLLSQYYKPEPIPKIHELAEALHARGHEVTVVTAFPHYPSGTLYPGTKLRLFRRERVDGIQVVRTFIVPYHGRSPLGRIVNYLSFMLSAPLAAFLSPACDVLYVWHPPLTTGLAGWALSRMKRAPFVYDVQDIWPESAIASGMLRDGVLVRLIRRMERFVYRHASRILTVTEDARQNLLGKGVPAGRVQVIGNWVDDSAFAEPDIGERERVRSEQGWGNRFVVLFAGNLGLVQNLENALVAAGRVRGRAMLLAVMGDGADRKRLQRVARDSDLGDRVMFIERQPASDMAAYFAAADALLVTLRRSEVERYVIPSKTLAYMAAGRPLVVAMAGPAAELVRTVNAGLTATPDDPDALAAAFESMASLPPGQRGAMGLRGKEWALQHFAKDRLVIAYEEILQQVAERGR